jgi:alpha-glucosidase
MASQEYVSKEPVEIIAPENPQTPWRCMAISEYLSDIIESNTIESLSAPSKVENTDWIKPGVGVFPWWGYSLANDEPEIMKQYIDFAAEMDWDYVEFDIALIGNNGGLAANYWKNISYIPEIIDYATSKGIKIIGWDERINLDTPEKRDTIFSIYKKWGIAGIKTDFINSDKQVAMKWYEDVTAHAAKYELMISFHGSITPRGLRRTYPNIMTYEGVRGAEYYKFGYKPNMPTPQHNCTLPFTRNVSGPMDYTPTSFSAKDRKTTAAHELALPFVYESAG